MQCYRSRSKNADICRFNCVLVDRPEPKILPVADDAIAELVQTVGEIKLTPQEREIVTSWLTLMEGEFRVLKAAQDTFLEKVQAQKSGGHDFSGTETPQAAYNLILAQLEGAIRTGRSPVFHLNKTAKTLWGLSLLLLLLIIADKLRPFA